MIKLNSPLESLEIITNNYERNAIEINSEFDLASIDFEGENISKVEEIIVELESKQI